ncbi:TPA: hypothetical protein I9097_000149 [Clostridium perfringens]|uniref:hypothetical protein n=1 Tax=Clostridium perfringens TaxID=1502 RepID=UPI001A20BFA5|nr:hypothetical protein [Clostridium perfringens]WCM71334.1 hypothetical protein LZD60_08145 [Clostridium perfringens]HAT4312918.1 hypothetical protein [Clostridium perfringens]
MGYKALYGKNISKNNDGSKNHQLTFLREVFPHEERKIRENLRNILDFHKLIYKQNNIDMALEEIKNSIKFDRNVLEKMPKLISDYLTSVRAYQDQTKHFLKEKFPSAVEIFEQAKRDEYDGKFCYRYTDQLRNFLQHCESIPYTRVEQFYQNEEKQIKFYMKNEEFVNMFPAMKSKFKKELMLEPNKDIDVIEQLLNLKECINVIHQKIINASIDDNLYNSMIFIMNYKKKYPEYDDILMTTRIKPGAKNIQGLEDFQFGFVKMLLDNMSISFK